MTDFTGQGDIDLKNIYKIENLKDPTLNQDAATKKYVDDNVGTVAWGGITGTISNQADLQAELDAKEDSLTFSTGLTRTVDTITTNDSQIVHQNLSGAGTNTHAQIDTHISDSTIHFTQAGITITASQVSDFDTEVSNNSSVVANTAKVTNVSTNLIEGASTLTTVDIDSSDGTNATLLAASTLRAGLLTKVKFDEIVANTLKISYTDSAAVSSNTTHRTSSGTDHSDVGLNNTHRGLTTGNPHNVTLADVGGTTDHTALSNIGTNTHAQIDTHIANVTTNPHSVDASDVGLGNVLNVATDDTAYNATSWNTNLDSATKNAIRDKVETMDTAIGLNTAKQTNVSTNLSEGSTTNTTVDVNSSDGTNATLAAASTTRAGVMTKAKFDEVVVNSAHSADNTQAHSDYLLNSGTDTAVGPLKTTADNSTADTEYIPNVLYNTDATPPTASTVPIGTIYVQYTA